MKSRVMMLIGDRRLEPEEWEVPRVGPREALIKIEACGMCGSDVEEYRGTFAANKIIRYPLIPGHEPIGRVVEIGREAAKSWRVKVDDRVALEPNLSCGRCEMCLGGNYINCRSLMPPGAPPAYGFTPADVGHGFWGGYSEYMHLHERTILHTVPASMPLAFASLYQPLAAGIRWAVQLPKTRLGDAVLILGHGQRGLGSVVAARRAGASLIIVTGTSRSKKKMQLARALGAHHVIAADTENVVERINEITGGRGVDVIVDTVPVATKPIVDAIEVARVGATLVLAGIKGPVGVSLNVDRLVYKEMHLVGVYSQGYESYIEAFRILDERPPDLAQMHTHEFPLDRADEALKVFGRELPSAAEPICMTLHPDPATMSARQGGAA
jgi:threonine dehydrogenase-like Zn-dependent dehydrogenase